jgi:aspartyl-tRNA(Asn)/glutamyl-tRNA(Gln) amidotransferase subunit C
MAVTQADVLHVAELARLAVAPDRLDHLVSELNGILAHMDILEKTDTSAIESNVAVPVESTPLRSDSSGPLQMLTTRESFAPSMRDGFFIVPRLSTHEDTVSDSAS